MNNQIKNAVILYIISIFFWGSMVIYREIKKQDVAILRKNIFGNLNGWSLLHFIHYTALGYMAPDYFWYLVLIGFLFEIAEMGLNKFSKYIDSKIVEDTMVNTSGLIFGVILFNFYPKKINLWRIFIKH